MVYCSSLHSINIKRIIKIIIAKHFNLPIKIKQNSDELTQPLIEYTNEYELVISKHRILTIFGYLKTVEKEFEWLNKIPVDIGNIILKYYGNMKYTKIEKKNKKQTKEEKHKKRKRRKKLKK